jgi:hypothetical protein
VLQSKSLAGGFFEDFAHRSRYAGSHKATRGDPHGNGKCTFQTSRNRMASRRIRSRRDEQILPMINSRYVALPSSMSSLTILPYPIPLHQTLDLSIYSEELTYLFHRTQICPLISHPLDDRPAVASTKDLDPCAQMCGAGESVACR